MPQEQWFFDPFVPDLVTIRGSRFAADAIDVPWESLPTELIKREQQCWNFHPERRWHGYARLCADGYAMVDPNKLMLLTPGIDRKTGDYLDFGVPATVVANYPARAARRAREVRPQQHPVPDDAGRGRKQAQHADRQARQVQEPVGRATRRWQEVLPTLYAAHSERYAGYTLQQGVQRDACVLPQRATSRNCSGGASAPIELPGTGDVCRRTPTRRWSATTSTTCRSTRSRAAISATLALIYPPGIGVVVPGERWDERAQPMLDYFLAFEESFNRFPGFNYEVQGVYPGEGGRPHPLPHLRGARVELSATHSRPRRRRDG